MSRPWLSKRLRLQRFRRCPHGDAVDRDRIVGDALHHERLRCSFWRRHPDIAELPLSKGDLVVCVPILARHEEIQHRVPGNSGALERKQEGARKGAHRVRCLRGEVEDDEERCSHVTWAAEAGSGFRPSRRPGHTYDVAVTNIPTLITYRVQVVTCPAVP